MTNRMIQLARRPSGEPQPEDFTLVEADRPKPGPGEMLLRTVFLALDPYLRSAIAGRHMSGAVQVGDVMPGSTVGQVVESNLDGFAPGDYVLTLGGWRDFSLSDGTGATKLDSAQGPLSAHLGVFGMPGLTAFAALNEIARPKLGDTVCVSSATGGVGTAAGHIAKIMGCRTVGIAGGADKCAYAVAELGYAACIDYRAEGWVERLRAACPEGIDVYLHNSTIGVLGGVMGCLAQGARAVIAGLVDQYNMDTIPPGPNPAALVGARAWMTGVVVYDHYDKMPTYKALAAQWWREGRFPFKEDRTEGLENAPAAFAAMMRGDNFGKAIVVVGPEQQ